MLEGIYEWMRGIACYLVLVTAAFQMLANQSYRKYVRLFTGMILIFLMMEPAIKLFGNGDEEFLGMAGEAYDRMVAQMEEQMERLEQDTFREEETEGILPTLEEEEGRRIEVGEIQIGSRK